VEEIEKAVQFNKATCRWTIMGEATEVRRTDERTEILAELRQATEPPRVFRRPFRLSHAARAGCSSMA